MTNRAMALVQELGQRFNAGDFAAAARAFAYPQPVQVARTMTVIASAAEMTQVLAAYRGANLARGLAPSAPQIVAQELPRNGRFRIWVDWVYGDAGAPATPRTRNIYYCSVDGGRIMIEMSEYIRLPAAGVTVADILPRRRTA